MAIVTIRGYRVMVTENHDEQCTVFETTDGELICSVSYGLNYVAVIRDAHDNVAEYFKKRLEED